MPIKNIVILIFLLLFKFTGFSANSFKVVLDGVNPSTTINFAKQEFLLLFKKAIDASDFHNSQFTVVFKKDAQLKNGAFAYNVSGNSQAFVIVLSGADEMCISHSVYTFLEKIGYLFEMSGITTSSIFNFNILKGDSEKTIPFTRWRGIRQHVNFPMDISSYPIEEAKEYLRNLVRLRFNKLAVHSYPNLWHEVKNKDTTILGGNFFYGRRQSIPNLPIFKNNIRFNQKEFCIPVIEPFYEMPEIRSKMAISWMKQLLVYAKEIGLRIQFSIEPRSTGDMNFILETCHSVMDAYPMIDELEIITEEIGGWGKKCTAEQTKSILIEQFGIGVLKDTIVTSAIRPEQTDLDNLFFQMGRNIKAIKILEKTPSKSAHKIIYKIGVYCAMVDYAKAAYRLARVYLPNSEVSIMPGHGSKRVAQNFPIISNSKKDIQKTAIYSWIEFDGLMFTQQNSIEGIENLMQYLNKINGSTQINSILFNHWRTGENITTAKYAATATIEGPIKRKDFYYSYASKLGINQKDQYYTAMNQLEMIDWISTTDLPNIGFCWPGAWLTGAPFTWMNPSNIQKVDSMYANVNYILAKLLAENKLLAGKNYLQFLVNRISTSRIYLQAFLAGTGIQKIKKDPLANLTDQEKNKAVNICNQALLLFDEYLKLHVKMMPDRGSEGTLINMWHAPIYGLKVLRNKYGAIPLDVLPVLDKEIDAPPLPIFIKN
ncbi:MAG: hypothetical protein WCL56_07380 [Sediminibacterium sp.]|jgi:hypothetical protein